MASRSDNEILAEIHDSKREVDRHVEAGKDLQKSLEQLLAKTPLKQVLYYEKTRNELLKSLDALEDKRSFLTDSTPSARIFAGPHILNRAGYAAYLLKNNPEKRKGPEESCSEKGEIERASELVDRKLQLCSRWLQALENTRKKFQNELRKLLQHTQRSLDLGFSPIACEYQEIESLAGLFFDGGDYALKKTTKQKRRNESKGRKPLTASQVGEKLRAEMGKYMEGVRGNSERVRATRKKHVLLQAAHQRVEELEEASSGARSNRYSRVSVAILGLHFAFACEQKLDEGKMKSEVRVEYERVIANAKHDCIKNALRELSGEGTVSERELSLLRYVKPVRTAWLEVVEEG